jgi:protein gp37
MANLTEIEWTEVTWNPVAGCTIVSPGCTNCYAMRMAARLEAMGHPKYLGTTRRSGNRFVWTGRIALDQDALFAPAKWRKPRRIFVNSMSDLFHPSVPKGFIKQVWRAMEQANWHTYQILTKRPDRMADVLAESDLGALPNVWLGTSVESNEFVGRLDDLRRVPAAVRFVSFEPLLGSVDEANLSKVNWAIVGGESGPRARPMEEAWVAEIQEACSEAGVAFFFKQWGGRNKKAAGRVLQGRTWDEYPEALSLESH